jgi:tetratricopeptide (TPR) repeat protein
MQQNVVAARSIAVLPFYDLDAAMVDRTLTQAFAASLQDGLSSLGPARVSVLEPDFAVSRDRIADLSKGGYAHRGRAIVTGTVRMVQGRQRISFQLIDPVSTETLLSHLWEGEKGNDLASAVSKEINQAIYAILSGNDWSDLIRARSDPGLRNEAAYQALKAGRQIDHSSTADSDNAISLFKRALDIEPNSSLAHSYLAMEATGRIHLNPDRSYLDLGKKEAEIALQLSPESAEAHRALSGVYYWEGKFSEALEQALQTIEMGGLGDRVALFVGMILDMLGRTDQALAWHEVASQLTEKPGEADSSIGDCWTKLGDDVQAERAYKRGIELRPGSYAGIVGMARLRMLQGDYDAAREICRSVSGPRGELAEITAQIEFFARRFDVATELYRDLHRVSPNGGGSFYGAMTYCSAAGRAKQGLGEMSEAKRILEDCLTKERANAEREPGNPEAVYRLAAAEASLGMTEASLSHLRKAVALGWVDYRSLNLDPRFDLLRGLEFQTIINELSAKVAGMRRQATTKLGPSK